MRVTIIGAGKMGRGIGTRLVAGGHDVEVVDRDPDEARALAEELQAAAQGGGSAQAVDQDAALGGEVVVLAVYYPATLEAAEQYGERLAGKVVVEISNPVDFATFDGLATPPDTSAAEQLAAAAPAAAVVKAFNTTFGNTLVPGEAGGQTLDVLIAGDDAEAKRKVSELIESGGLRPLDVGPLRRARQLEQVGFLHIAVQEPLGAGFASALKLHW
jgi:NADPH-dependent F420 reductase